MNGWIKLHRKLLNNDALFRSGATFPVFCWLLLMADRDGVVTVGRNQMASWLKIKPSTVYLALKRLENLTIIRLKPNNKMTTVYICNWDTYQKEPDSKITTKQQQDNTKQEVRIENKNNTSEVLDITNSITGRSFRVLPRTAAATLKEFSLPEITLALTNLAKDPWHREKLKELSLDYLLRPTTIDKFLTLKTNVPSRGYA